MSAWREMSVSRRMELLMPMVKDGYSFTMMGAVVGASRGAVAGFLHRRGVSLLTPSSVHATPKLAGKPVVVTDLPEPTRECVPISGLGRHVCRWPVERVNGAWMFCGDHAAKGVYCDAHRAVAYMEKTDG